MMITLFASAPSSFYLLFGRQKDFFLTFRVSGSADYTKNNIIQFHTIHRRVRRRCWFESSINGIIIIMDKFQFTFSLSVLLYPDK